MTGGAGVVSAHASTGGSSHASMLGRQMSTVPGTVIWESVVSGPEYVHSSFGCPRCFFTLTVISTQWGPAVNSASPACKA